MRRGRTFTPTLTSLLTRYDLAHNQVVVSSSQCRTEEQVRTVLAHELVHMYDHCANKMDWTNPHHLACSEVRAASLAHCQSPVSSALHDGGSWSSLASQHSECVKTKAARSVQVSQEYYVHLTELSLTAHHEDQSPGGQSGCGGGLHEMLPRPGTCRTTQMSLITSQ